VIAHCPARLFAEPILECCHDREQAQLPEIAIQREESGTKGRYIAGIANIDGEAEPMRD
jgi:hypothetical protein